MSHRAFLIACALAAHALAAAKPAEATTRWTRELSAQSGGWNTQNYPRMMGDVNGDGFADLIGFGHWGVSVALSTGGAFTPAEGWSGEFALGVGGWTADYPRMMGDVNGDGRDDVIGFGHWGVSVALSNGRRFEPGRLWYAGMGYSHTWRVQHHERWVGDVNGDGRADLIGFGQHAVVVALSTGDGFAPEQVWSHDMIGNQGYVPAYHARLIADVDGDGRADAVAFHHWGVSIARSTGTGFAPTQWALSDMGYSQRGGTVQVPRSVADVNGDGRADAIAFIDEGVFVALSQGTYFDTARVWLDTYGAQTGWAAHHARVMGDVDGDGRADAVGFADDGVRVATSVADRFDNAFQPLAGGDFVTRLRQVSKGLCLSTTGAITSQRSCDAALPMGWVLEARANGTYLVIQDGKCLYADHRGETAERVWVDAGGCGVPGTHWYVERNAEGRVRLRNARNDKCLRVPGHTRNDGEEARVVTCDASDHQLYSVETMRPRTMVTTLRVRHSGRCLSTEGGWNVTQRGCNGNPHQSFTLTDNGHGALSLRSQGNDQCLALSGTGRGNLLVSAACNPGDAWQRFAMKDLGGGQRLFVSQQTGHCVDIEGGHGHDGGRALMWDCHGGTNQHFAMPEMAAAGVMQFSLQNVGGAGGTALVIANQEGGYVTRDPVAIVAYLRNSGSIVDEQDFIALLTPPQRAEFAARVGAWNAALPGIVSVSAQVISVSADYDIGLDGADLGINASVISTQLEIGGVARTEVRLLSAEARVTVRNDGIAFGPSADIIAGEAGFGDPDGSYAGIGGGLGTRGFSVAARWGQDGQYGVTVPLGVVAVDLYVSGDDVITAAVFAGDVGEWVGDAAADAFVTGFGWVGGAFGTAVGAIGGFFDDVGGWFEDVGDGFCDFFGC